MFSNFSNGLPFSKYGPDYICYSLIKYEEDKNGKDFNCEYLNDWGNRFQGVYDINKVVLKPQKTDPKIAKVDKEHPVSDGRKNLTIGLQILRFTDWPLGIK